PGGSHTSTLPTSHSAPSAARSNQRPPAWGSITIVSGSTAPMWWLLLGHHRPIPAVKVSKARLCGTATLTLRRTGAGWMVLVTLIVPFPFGLGLEGLQRHAPELVQPGPQRPQT